MIVDATLTRFAAFSGLASRRSLVYTLPTMIPHSLTPDAFRQLQADLGLTNAACARMLGVTVHAVEHWRSGRRPVPGPVAAAMELLLANRQLELALDLHIEKVKELAARAGELDDLRAAVRALLAAHSAGRDLAEAIAGLAARLDRTPLLH